MRQGERRQRERKNHGARLRGNYAALPVVVVADVAAKRRQKQHRHLARKAEDPEQRGGTRQLVDQPQLRGRLHPRADKRYELSRDEKLEVAVLHRAEAR